MTLETCRVKVGDRVIQLTADNGVYLGPPSTVERIVPDGKRCTVLVRTPAGALASIRGRLLADGETAVAHLRRAV